MQSKWWESHPGKLIEKGDLRGVDLFLRRCQIEKVGAVDFGDVDLFSGFWRPLDSDQVAHDFRWVAVTFKGPGVDGLAGFLFDRIQSDEWPGGGKAGFFGELTFSADEQVFTFADFAFGDGPYP